MALSTSAIIPPDVEMKIEPEHRTDKEIWDEIFYYKLGGVVFHLKAMAIFEKHHLKGYAKMHEYHARHEFASATHILGDCINYLNSDLLIDFTKAHPVPTITLHGDNMKDLMIHGLELYEDWEDDVYRKLKHWKHELKETKEHIDYLIHDVRKEREFIHELWEEMEKCNYDETHLKNLDEKLHHYCEKKMG